MAKSSSLAKGRKEERERERKRGKRDESEREREIQGCEKGVKDRWRDRDAEHHYEIIHVCVNYV